MKTKSILFVVWIFVSCSTVFAQKLHWTNFENLNDSLRVQKKPLMIFIHTNWCTYCRMQEHSMVKDSFLVSLLNKNFYCLKLNAESPETIDFLGRKYLYKPSGDGTGVNALTEFLAKENGMLVYPTTVFLSKDLKLIRRICGLTVSKELIKVFEALGFL